MKYIRYLFFLIVITAGCRRDPFKVDVASVRAELSVSRFEKELFTADPAGLEQLIPVWKQKYGPFLQNFSYIAKLGSVDDPGFPDRLRLFVTDYSNYLIYKRTMEVFPDLDTFTHELSFAFRHYRYYFKNKPVPRVVTFISGLNQSAMTDDSLLAISLDKYLGRQEEIYKKAGLYNYLVNNMHPGKLVSDCMLFWGETEFPYHDSINTLATQMIYKGRLYYFLNAMVPYQPDTLRWGYSSGDLATCLSDEKAMWAALIENKFLFSTDRFTIDKFILEGPFTKDFGRQSPARAAVWIGYRIVSAYMENNPEVTLPQLMEERDYMKILNLSSYNP